jgi:hypothetical protein
MIRLTCTQCKSVLEMDDAFAGGVCRCQHCGTIQTVPSHLKGSAATVGAGTAAKSLYTGTGAGKAPGAGRESATGLYDLADAVASSGLSRSSLQNRPPTTAYAGPETVKPAPPPPSRTPLLIGAGAIIAVLLGVVVWLVLGRGTPAPQTPDQANPIAPAPAVDTTPKPAVVPAPVAAPHFFTIPIDAKKTVYVIDRSDSAKQTLDTVKAAVFNSIDSLGPTREFAVVFWGKPGEKDMKQWSFPEKGMALATPQQSESVRNKFADVQAFGASDISAAMKQACGLKPDVIFLVTAKGIDLDDSFARSADAARKSSAAKVYTIDVANGEGKKYLEPLATKTHGIYTSYSPLDLRPD